MDKDKLLGPIIRSEVKARRRGEKIAAQAALRATEAEEQKRAADKRQEAFDTLGKRNTAVIDRVQAFTEGGTRWDVDYEVPRADKQTKRGKVVVLAPAPKSKVTPDHVAVCLVSYGETRSNFRADKPQADKRWVQFRFAFVPQDKLDDVLGERDGYPLGHLAADELKMIRDEESFFDELGHDGVYTSAASMCGKTLNARYTLSRAKRKAYDSGLRACTTVVETAEQNLEWVLQAAADTELNPHLQHPADATQLEKPQAS